jgi:hypothetical protein
MAHAALGCYLGTSCLDISVSSAVVVVKGLHHFFRDAIPFVAGTAPCTTAVAILDQFNAKRNEAGRL